MKICFFCVVLFKKILAFFVIVGSLFLLGAGLSFAFFTFCNLSNFKDLKKLKLKIFIKIILKKLIFIEKQ